MLDRLAGHQLVEGVVGEPAATQAEFAQDVRGRVARLALAGAAPAQESLAVAYASVGGPGTVVRVGPRPS